MSSFQQKTLFGALFLGAFWLIFARNFIFPSVGVMGFLTILFMGLWMGWRQDVMLFFAIISGFLSLFLFIFTIIPVYTHTPSLDGFNTNTFPVIRCIENNEPSNITVQINAYVTKNNSNNQICSQNGFPLYVGQKVTRTDTGSIVIDIQNGSSIFIQGPANGSLQRTNNGYIFPTNAAKVVSPFTPGQSNYENPLQYALFSDHERAKKEYLKANFPRERENSRVLTQVAIWKMRILGIFNREHSDAVKNLNYYLNAIK